MISLIITIVVIVGIIVYIAEEARLGLYAFDVVFPLVIGFFIWCVSHLVLVFGLSLLVGETTSETETSQLKALGTDSTTQGAFFLGIGTVDEERVISYIVTNDDGSFSLDNKPTEDSKIWEEDDVEPIMEKKTPISDRWWISFIPVDLFPTYEFTVPTGSVSDSYSVEP